MEVKERLLMLYELHKTDKELEELNALKGDLPLRIEELKGEKEIKDSEREAIKSELDEITEQEKKLKEENDKSFKHIQKNDEVLRAGGANTNDEYNALANEIDTAYEVIEKNDELLENEISPRINELTLKMKTLGMDLDDISEKLHIAEEELDELIKINEEEERELTEKRNDVITKLGKEDLAMYERINKVKPGEAIALVRKGSCLGCYNSIPPQREIEIKMSKEFFHCESCGRLLIHEDITK